SPRRPAPTPRGPAEGAPPPRRPRVRRVRCASWRYLLLGERQRLLPLEAEFLRSEEHTSELQSPCNVVCRLLLEKKFVPLARPKTQNLPMSGTLPPPVFRRNSADRACRLAHCAVHRKTSFPHMHPDLSSQFRHLY